MPSNTRQKPAPKRAPSGQKHDESSAPASGAPAAAVVAQARRPALTQQEAFDKAFAAFHARSYADALPWFEAASNGAHLGMAHTATVYARICREKVARAEPVLSGPEDHYNFAVALMNARKFAEAQTHLVRAAELSPKSDHIHYALALTRGLGGDLAGARASLERAIDLNPRNRFAARNDPDFAELIQFPQIADLLYPGSTGQ